MTVRSTALAMAAAMIVFVAPAAAGPLEDQVTAAYAAWDAAFNKGDAKAIASAYAEDATFLPADHKVYEGPAGVETFFTGLLANGVTGHKLTLVKAYDRGDTVAAAAKWSVEGKDDKGNPATFTGLATHVFAKQPDGSLKLLVHGFN